MGGEDVGGEDVGGEDVGGGQCKCIGADLLNMYGVSSVTESGYKTGFPPQSRF